MQRILIIDDNEDFRDLLKVTLESEGYEVAAAPDGARGLQAFATGGFAVVITDIFMPGKEGIETIAELRGRFPGTRIIAMTGRPSMTDFDPLSIAAELGASRTLRKPFDPAEMIDAVRMLAPLPARPAS